MSRKLKNDTLYMTLFALGISFLLRIEPIASQLSNDIILLKVYIVCLCILQYIFRYVKYLQLKYIENLVIIFSPQIPYRLPYPFYPEKQFTVLEQAYKTARFVVRELVSFLTKTFKN